MAFSSPIDLGYAAQIKEGEGGTIDGIEEASGTVWILLDDTHRGLHEWHNHIWLEPFGTEDILGACVIQITCARLSSVA